MRTHIPQHLVISQALSNKEINYLTGQCCPLFILEWCVTNQADDQDPQNESSQMWVVG